MKPNDTKKPNVGVGVFILRNGKFLVGKRKGSFQTGTWAIPGGALEFNESPEDAAIREIKEETNCEITNVRFGAVTNDRFYDEGKHFITLWMLADWVSGEGENLEPDKFADQRWIDFDTIPEPLFLSWHQLMESEFYEGLRTALRRSIKEEQS